MLFCTPENRIYQRRAIVAIVVYAAVVIADAFAFARGIVPASLAIPVALLPVIPAVFVLRPMLAALRNLDELQRKIQYEGIAFAFGVTAIGSLAVGLLQMFANIPDVSWTWVWPILGASWAVGVTVSRRRYR